MQIRLPAINQTLGRTRGHAALYLSPLTRTRLTQAERTFRLQIPGSTELQPVYPQQEMRELLRSTYVHLSSTQMYGKMYSILRLTLYLITVPKLFLINRTILPSSMFCIL